MKGYLFTLRTSRGAYRGGNGNSLQNSCLGNPMEGGAWRAAAYGVAELDTEHARKGAYVSAGPWS